VIPCRESSPSSVNVFISIMPNTSGCPATSQQGQFHLLTEQEWIEATKKLRRSPAALHVLYYLKTQPLAGENGLEMTVHDIATVLDYHASTVSRALKLLEDEKYISLELISVRIRIASRFSSDGEIVRVRTGHRVDATPVACTHLLTTGEKCVDCAENDTRQDFVPTCGKLDVVPITRSDLVLKETIGTSYFGDEQRGQLVQPQNPCGDADPTNPPEVEPYEPLPRDGTTNTDLLIERLV